VKTMSRNNAGNVISSASFVFQLYLLPGFHIGMLISRVS
jgi:hypothetical protein